MEVIVESAPPIRIKCVYCGHTYAPRKMESKLGNGKRRCPKCDRIIVAPPMKLGEVRIETDKAVTVKASPTIAVRMVKMRDIANNPDFMEWLDECNHNGTPVTVEAYLQWHSQA